MSCHRAYEIDLEDLLLEPESQAFVEFEAHARGCEDCAQALSLERSLTAHLRGDTPGGLDWHPSDAQLLQYRAARGDLAEGLESRIQSHFSACAPCRDAFHAFSAMAHAPVASAAPSLLERVALAARSLFLRPATASALAAALLAVFGLFLVLGEPDEQAGDWTRGREPIALPEIVDVDPETRIFSLRLDEGAPGVLSEGAVPSGEWLELQLLVPEAFADRQQVWVRASPLVGEARPFEGGALVVPGASPFVRVRLASDWLAVGSYEITVHERDPGAPVSHRYVLEVR